MLPHCKTNIWKIYYCYLAGSFLIGSMLIMPTLAKEESAAGKTNIVTPGYAGPYCGAFCLYSTIKLAGNHIDIKDLIKPEYIGSRKGSSLAELQLASEDHKMYAVPLVKLTTRELRQSPYPIILHVKSSIDKKEYDHFELYLGCKNGRAKLFDPPEPVDLVSFSDLAPRWDGTGLIVSSTPIQTNILFTPARKCLILYVVIGIGLICIIHMFRRWLLHLSPLDTHRKLLGISVAQCGGLVILALLWGMIYHFTDNEGLLANADAAASIQDAHQGNFIPKISKKKIEHLLTKGNAVFIDARYAKDYEQGHLEGAINIPVNAEDRERQRATVNITKTAPIVVYCQSKGCKFAEEVTKKLTADGFNNISIFRGGWHEWEAKNND